MEEQPSQNIPPEIPGTPQTSLRKIAMLPEVQNRKPYPSIGAAFGLLAIVMAINFIGSTVLGWMEQIFPSATEPAYMVVYLIAYLVALRIGLTFRRSNRIAFKAGSWFMWPLLIVVTVLFLIVREPLLSLFNGRNLPDRDIITGLDFVNPYFVVITVFAAPLFEELIFRGIILDGFLQRQQPWRAIILSALLFAIAHVNIPQFINGFLIGVLMGWVYWKTRSLWLCILIHFVNNLCATLLLYYYNPYRSAIIQMSPNTGIFILIYICSLSALAIFSIIIYYYYQEKELDKYDDQM